MMGAIQWLSMHRMAIRFCATAYRIQPMTQHILHNVALECIQGNIADQPDIDAVVNAANAHLRTGGGVAGAIHAAAGPGLAEECRPFAPIEPGQAVITTAHNLPNRYVIHCLGPVYGIDEPAADLLADCYRNALILAEKNNLASIAFPAISTGAFGYPLRDATRISLTTVINEIPQLHNVTHIRFVLFSSSDLVLYHEILGEIMRQMSMS